MAVSYNVLLTLLLLTKCGGVIWMASIHGWRAFLLIETFKESTMDVKAEIAENDKIIVDDSE